MAKDRHARLPLEVRWRVPIAVPAGEAVVEIAYIRFLDDAVRVTVRRFAQQTYAPHHLTDVPLPVAIQGWAVWVNDENVTPDPLAFLDACYAGWAVLVEALPKYAQILAQALAMRAQTEGWDGQELEVQVDYAGLGQASAKPEVSLLRTEPVAVQPLDADNE